MPISFAVDHERRRVHAVGSGTFTMEEMSRYIEDRTRQGVYEYPQLLDMLNCEVEVPEHQSILVRAHETRRQVQAGPVPRTAIIALPGTATYGYFRQLAMQASFARASVEVFSNHEDAVAWLEADRSSE